MCYNELEKASIYDKTLMMIAAKTDEERKTIAGVEERLVGMAEEMTTFEKMTKYGSRYNDQGWIDARMDEEYELGIHDKAIDTAEKMLEKALDVNLISEITGLSIEEINSLKN